MVFGLALVLALVLGVGTDGARRGARGPLRLGQTNTINNALTSSRAPTRVPCSRWTTTLRHPGAGPGPEGGAGKQPLNVNAEAGKAGNLNADELDGKSADGLVRVAFFDGESQPAAEGGKRDAGHDGDHRPGLRLPRHRRQLQHL